MELLVIISLVITVLFTRYYIKDPLSKVFLYIFLVMWHGSILGALLDEELFYNVRDSTILLLLGGVILFVFGFSRVKINKQTYTNCNLENLDFQIERITKNRILLVIVGIFAVYMVYCFLRFFAILQIAQSAAEIRGEYFDPTSQLYGPRFHFFNTYFFTPGIVVLSGLMCYCLLRKRCLLFILMLICLVAYHSLSGGRFGYVLMFVSVYVVWALYNNKYKIEIKLKTVLVLAMALALGYICLAFITGLRLDGFSGFSIEALADGVEGLNEHLKIYISGPIVAFDQGLTNDSFVRAAGGYKYGQYLLNPIFNIISLLQKFVGGAGLDLPIAQVAEAQQNTKIEIGPEMTYNALYTWDISFYVDFGVLGVLVMNFIVGAWIRSVFKMFYKKPTLSAYLIICQIAQICILSTFNACWYSMMTFILILFLYFTHKYERVAVKVDKNLCKV